MLRAAIIGLGKMGLSHQSMVNVHPQLRLIAVCDSSGYVLDVLSKYTGVKTYTDYKKMFAEEQLDCVFVATPSRYHAEIVNSALERNLHVFCEKPFALDPAIGFALAETAESRKLVNQVGYHYRFVATFNETKKLLDRNIIGELHHVRAEAYGPVVLRPKGATWRSQKSEGGGCLFDYSCHAIDLLNYLVGRPLAVSGSSASHARCRTRSPDKLRALHGWHADLRVARNKRLGILRFVVGKRLLFSQMAVAPPATCSPLEGDCRRPRRQTATGPARVRFFFCVPHSNPAGYCWSRPAMSACHGATHRSIAPTRKFSATVISMMIDPR